MSTVNEEPVSNERSLNFLEEIIEKSLSDGSVKQIHTRFPPEPNGYLHIGLPRVSASILVWLNVTVDCVIFVSTILTP